MICINLLPWRESKLKRIKKVLVYQLIGILIFSGFGVAAFRFVYSARINDKTIDVEQFRLANLNVLEKIELLDANVYTPGEQQGSHRNLSEIINQRNLIPGILSVLTKEKINGQFTRLSLNYQTLLINYSSANVEGAMSLFQLLNNHPAFCHFSFKPEDAMSGDTKLINYEFAAKLCERTEF